MIFNGDWGRSFFFRIFLVFIVFYILSLFFCRGEQIQKLPFSNPGHTAVFTTDNFRSGGDWGFKEILEWLPEDTRAELAINENTAVLAVIMSENGNQRIYKFSTKLSLGGMRNEVYGIVAQKNNVAITAKDYPANYGGLIFNLIFLLFIGFILYNFIRMRGGLGGGKSDGIFSAGKSRAKLAAKDTLRIKFDDVGGLGEAKEEVMDIIQYLRDPVSFGWMGGRPVSGTLFKGPPGCGKTLMAKAIAGEANVPFFSVSGSEFVEMYVGVGASRVRDLFANARKNSPCIIFIDEFDALGRTRGRNAVGSHDEREQTLNQLLVEMDGFEARDGVQIIAATNRPDILDQGLLRPGRFDRQVMIGRPDLEGRTKIFEVHIKKLIENVRQNRQGPDLDFEDIFDGAINAEKLAKATPGLTGADIENALNETALAVAKRGRDCKITFADIEEGVDKVCMGKEKKTKIISNDDKKIIAYHEVGHAFTAWLDKHARAVRKISIIPRMNGSAGHTSFMERDNQMLTQKQLEADLKTAYGGRAAEAEFCGDISIGASGDINWITSIVNNMVRLWGMGGENAPINFCPAPSFVLGGGVSDNYELSEATKTRLDEAVGKITNGAYEDAVNSLRTHKEVVRAIVKLLTEKETISLEDMEEVIQKTDPELYDKIKGQ